MIKTLQPIVFFGSGPVAAASLRFLVNHFAIEAVITKASPDHHRRVAPVEVVARDHDLALYFANTKDELDQLISRQVFQSQIGVIVDFGVIVSAHTIAVFELGIVNSHFSLLPEWRGADPISFAILSGQTKTGVSLMLIEPSLDTGKILVQKSLVIGTDETTPTLTKRLIALSNQLLAEYLPRYIANDIKPRSQPHPDRATYSRKLTKEDGIIDWQKPAVRLEREIRAFVDWPKSRTTLAKREVIITKARVLPGTGPIGTLLPNSQELAVFTGDGVLVIDRVKPVGKAEISAAEFKRGYLR